MQAARPQLLAPALSPESGWDRAQCSCIVSILPSLLERRWRRLAGVCGWGGRAEVGVCILQAPGCRVAVPLQRPVELRWQAGRRRGVPALAAVRRGF
jgi:hypothetical protein